MTGANENRVQAEWGRALDNADPKAMLQSAIRQGARLVKTSYYKDHNMLVGSKLAAQNFNHIAVEEGAV